MAEARDPEAPIEIHFCNGAHCWKKQGYQPGNSDVLSDLAATCGTTIEALDGKTIEFEGHPVRIDCRDCLHGCLGRPRVDIVAEGKVIQVDSTTLPLLRLKFRQEFAGQSDATSEK